MTNTTYYWLKMVCTNLRVITFTHIYSFHFSEVLTTRLSEARKEMDQVEEKYLLNQSKLSEVEEELTQCRAMVDL